MTHVAFASDAAKDYAEGIGPVSDTTKDFVQQGYDAGVEDGIESTKLEFLAPDDPRWSVGTNMRIRGEMSNGCAVEGVLDDLGRLNIPGAGAFALNMFCACYLLPRDPEADLRDALEGVFKAYVKEPGKIDLLATVRANKIRLEMM